MPPISGVRSAKARAFRFSMFFNKCEQVCAKHTEACRVTLALNCGARWSVASSHCTLYVSPAVMRAHSHASSLALPVATAKPARRMQAMWSRGQHRCTLGRFGSQPRGVCRSVASSLRVPATLILQSHISQVVRATHRNNHCLKYTVHSPAMTMSLRCSKRAARDDIAHCTATSRKRSGYICTHAAHAVVSDATTNPATPPIALK